MGVIFFSTKIFNQLPTNILELQENKMLFKSALRKYLLTHVFYYVEEFYYITTIQINNFITSNILIHGPVSSVGIATELRAGRGMLLTTHPLLVARSWKSRAIPLPTLWATLGL
jgi:hypothetical protein